MGIGVFQLQTNQVARGLLALSCSLLFCGCDEQQKTSRANKLSVTSWDTSVVEPLEDVDPLTRQRLSQAERDVQQYLKQRDILQSMPPGAGAGATDDAEGLAIQPERRPSKTRKVVIFNDGPRKQSLNDLIAKTEVDQFEPSPLFRDQAPDPIVRKLDQGGSETPEVEASFLSGRLTQLMVDLRRELYIEGAHSDQPLLQLLPIAAMSMIDPEGALNPDAVPDLTTKERELLGALQTFFQTLGTRLENGEDVEEVIANGVNELRDAVIQEPSLQIPTLTLCYSVDGFGRYKVFNKYHFLAHDEQPVIVYVEIDDFTSETNEKGEWITKLSQKITIYSDRDGIPVWTSGDMQTAIDKARNQRHDFFLRQIITLPKALSVGKYQLKVHVRDEISGAEAEDSVDFEMVADPKLAVRVP